MTAKSCAWVRCEGWFLDPVGRLRRCPTCARFATDDDAAAAAFAFIARFEVLSDEHARVPCSPGCRGWKFARSSGWEAGWQVAACGTCGLFSEVEVLGVAERWLRDHLARPARYPRRARNIVVEVIADGLVGVAFGGAPTDEEWGDYVEVLGREGPAVAQIMWTRRAVPIGAQRRALRDQLGGYPLRTAVVSPYLWPYLAVKALRVLDPLVDAFPPGGIDAALVFLEIPPCEAEVVAERLASLRGELGRATP